MVIRGLAALAAMLSLSFSGGADRGIPVETGSVYCFAQEMEREDAQGIWLVRTPEGGSLMLGQRRLCPGDVLTLEQARQMTFHPGETDTAQETALVYLPVSAGKTEAAVQVQLSVRGKLQQPPIAQDFALETYENLSVTEKFKATDPENEPLTYAIVRQSRRGTVTLGEDGSFTYTPKKNKVGVDSFTYTATDASGKCSREATVTVTILKSKGGKPYVDTLGQPCRFAAEWMKNTGIFAGEQVSDSPCFDAQRPVSRGQFLAMLSRTLQLPEPQQQWLPEDGREVASWLKPYLAAAHRAGLTAALRPGGSLEEPITQAEADAMVQLALDLPQEVIPAWAQLLQEDDGGRALTRAQAAMLLYETHKLMDFAPGMRAIRSAAAQS